MIALTPEQEAVIEAGGSIFLAGPAGSGKSSALHHRLVQLLQSGEPAYTILVLVAEQDHVEPFLNFVHQSRLRPLTELSITTYYNLARELVTLFWPLVARPAGFIRPYQPPTFLSYDLAQLLMWQVVIPMIEDGAFADLRLRPQQIVSQLLDTLNRAALNGLSLDEANRRQLKTWSGEQDHIVHLRDAAIAAQRFRTVCLENNLLDLSLVVQVFDTQLVKHPRFRQYFVERYRHFMVDNIEEQTPAGQNFVNSLMDTTESVVIAYDAGGGYKRFLAADPTGAKMFRNRCQQAIDFKSNFTAAPVMHQLSHVVENFLVGTNKPTSGAEEAVFATISSRYRQEMIRELVVVLADLIQGGVQANEIAIIAPYLDGALRYGLAKELGAAGIPHFLLRRRSSPRDEPRVRAWITWLAIAHPTWGIRPVEYDVAEALSLTIAGIDPARAQLFAQELYRQEESVLLPVAHLAENMLKRLGEERIVLVEELRQWLIENGQDRYPIDMFLFQLFNNLLSQPHFQPEPEPAGGAVCDWLVRSAGRLRQAAGPMGLRTTAELGKSFIEGIYQGLVTANPPELGDPPDPDGVMISTIYGYLLAGRPVQLQVWLDTAATGWWDIPRQPLSNAFVLAQSWDPERPWTMAEDHQIRDELLSRIVRGLTNRCSGQVIFANSELDRRSIRQDGRLWHALYQVRNR